MILPRLKYLLFLCLTTAAQGTYAQETVDSVDLSKTARLALADGIYFDAMKAKMKDDNKQAAELLEEYITKKPGISAAYYELARIYHADKKTDKAKANVQKAMELDKDNKWYKEEYATLLAEEGNYADAAGVAGGLAKANPADLNYSLMAADYYERAQKYPEAIQYIDMALLRNPSDEDILLHKVQVYLSMNDAVKAAGVVQVLISKEPRNGKYYKLLAELYDNNKMPAKATELYEKALKLIPDDPAVQLGLAEHYIKTGDTTSYKAYLKKAIINKDIDVNTQLDFLKAYIQGMPDDATSIREGFPVIRQLVVQHPDDPSVLAYYGDFLEAANQHDSAVTVYKKALDIKPSAFNVWRNLLTNYTDARDADSLIKYSEKFMRLFPTQALAHYYNGIGYFNKKDYSHAVKSLNRAIDMQPESDKQVLAAMYATLADAYHSAKMDNLSDEAFDKALKLIPNDATLLNNYSYYLSERGQKLDEAEKMSKKALEARPGEATYLDTYGWILYKKGNYDRAREYIQKAVDLAGPRADGALYDHLGDVYYKLNDKTKALENWKTAKEKGGDNPLIDKKISEGKLYE